MSGCVQYGSALLARGDTERARQYLSLACGRTDGVEGCEELFASYPAADVDPDIERCYITSLARRCHAADADGCFDLARHIEGTPGVARVASDVRTRGEQLVAQEERRRAADAERQRQTWTTVGNVLQATGQAMSQLSLPASAPPRISYPPQRPTSSERSHTVSEDPSPTQDDSQRCLAAMVANCASPCGAEELCVCPGTGMLPRCVPVAEVGRVLTDGALADRAARLATDRERELREHSAASPTEHSPRGQTAPSPGEDSDGPVDPPETTREQQERLATAVGVCQGTSVGAYADIFAVDLGEWRRDHRAAGGSGVAGESMRAYRETLQRVTARHPGAYGGEARRSAERISEWLVANDVTACGISMPVEGVAELSAVEDDCRGRITGNYESCIHDLERAVSYLRALQAMAGCECSAAMTASGTVMEHRSGSVRGETH